MCDISVTSSNGYMRSGHFSTCSVSLRRFLKRYEDLSPQAAAWGLAWRGPRWGLAPGGGAGPLPSATARCNAPSLALCAELNFLIDVGRNCLSGILKQSSAGLVVRPGLKYQSTHLKENPLGLLIRYSRGKKRTFSGAAGRWSPGSGWDPRPSGCKMES